MSKNTVYSVYEYALDDDSTITLKPAPIKTMRAFNAVLTKGIPDTDEEGNETDDEAGFDWIMSMVLILLKKQRPDLTKEEAEDIIDIETAYKIIEICGGVKLNDPKLTEAVQKAAQAVA